MARARRALIACSILVATLVGHVWASGTLPDPLALALATVLAVALGTAIGERPRPAWQLIALAFGSQLALHAVLAIGGGHAGHAGRAGIVPDVAMLWAHAAAAVAIAALAIEADHVVEAIARFLGHTAPAPPALATPASAVSSITEEHRVLPARDRAWPRRGPPCRS